MCANSAYEKFSINMTPMKKILRIFIIKNDAKEIPSKANLFLNFIFGVEKFRMKKSKYAEPAMHAPINSKDKTES